MICERTYTTNKDLLQPVDKKKTYFCHIVRYVSDENNN